MPTRLTEVGDRERPDHCFLPRDARCYFWGEYTPHEHTNGKRWNFSATNQLIGNFKKKLDRRGQSDWKYKGRAIDEIAQRFAGFWRWADLQQTHRVALIPIPPSRARNDPMYDPRMVELLHAIARHSAVQLDIRDCLTFSGRYGASHEADARPRPADLLTELQFDTVTGLPFEKPGVIFLFDDLLTTGAHYRAAENMLSQNFPGVPIVGNFIARRIVPDPFADFDVLV